MSSNKVKLKAPSVQHANSRPIWVYLLALALGLGACNFTPRYAAFHVAVASPEALRGFVQEHCEGLTAQDADRLSVCQSADDRLWAFETGRLDMPPDPVVLAALEPR